MNAREQVNVWAAQYADAVDRNEASEGIHDLTTKIWALPEFDARAMLSGLVIAEGLALFREKDLAKLALIEDEVVASWR